MEAESVAAVEWERAGEEEALPLWRGDALPLWRGDALLPSELLEATDGDAAPDTVATDEHVGLMLQPPGLGHDAAQEHAAGTPVPAGQ